MSPAIRVDAGLRYPAPLSPTPNRVTSGSIFALQELWRRFASAPPTRPLIFTGLCKPPRRLEWREAPAAPGYSLWLESAGRIWKYAARQPIFEWPREIPLAPGAPICWKIAPLGPADAAITGQLWLLEPSLRAALTDVQRTLMKIGDEQKRVLAHALAAAEFGLYEQAVKLLDGLAAFNALSLRPPGRGQAALTHRTYIAILEDMRGSIPTDARLTVRSWIAARLAFHARALQCCLPHAGEASDRLCAPKKAGTA